MFRKIIAFLGLCLGWRLFCFVISLVLIIIIFYQLLLTLFIPCFSNVIILLILYCSLICIAFWTIFGY